MLISPCVILKYNIHVTSFRLVSFWNIGDSHGENVKAPKAHLLKLPLNNLKVFSNSAQYPTLSNMLLGHNLKFSISFYYNLDKTRYIQWHVDMLFQQ
jgi:hypothetical protein